MQRYIILNLLEHVNHIKFREGPDASPLPNNSSLSLIASISGSPMEPSPRLFI